MPLTSVRFAKAATVLLSVLLVTLTFARSPGTGDMDYWTRWAKHAEVDGMTRGYAADKADYPPYSSVILLAALRVARLFGGGIFEAIKLALFVFLCLTSLTFWLWTRNFWLAVGLHLSLLLGSMALGYLDIFFAPALLLAFWALKERRLVWFTLFYSIACLIKWQPIILAPFIFVYLLNIKRVGDWRQIDFKRLAWQVLWPGLVILIFTFLTFGVLPVLGSLRLAFSHNFLSGNALNFNWVITHFLHVFYPRQFGPLINGQARFIRTREFEITFVPRLLFLLLYAVALFSFFRREKTFEGLLLFALTGYLAYFIFNIGVHENHWFIAVLLATILFWVNGAHLFLLLNLILMSNVNLFLFYGVNGRGLGFSRLITSGLDSALVLSIFNVGFFLGLWGVTVFHRRPQAAPATYASDALPANG
jgi:hypothetical protein